MSFAIDSSNCGLLAELLHISYNLSSRRLSIVHMAVPCGLCREVCVGFVGCCVNSYLLDG
jgi:hypothetical protein